MYRVSSLAKLWLQIASVPMKVLRNSFVYIALEVFWYTPRISYSFCVPLATDIVPIYTRLPHIFHSGLPHWEVRHIWYTPRISYSTCVPLTTDIIPMYRPSHIFHCGDLCMEHWVLGPRGSSRMKRSWPEGGKCFLCTEHWGNAIDSKLRGQFDWKWLFGRLSDYLAS